MKLQILGNIKRIFRSDWEKKNHLHLHGPFCPDSQNPNLSDLMSFHSNKLALPLATIWKYLPKVDLDVSPRGKILDYINCDSGSRHVY